MRLRSSSSSRLPHPFGGLSQARKHEFGARRVSRFARITKKKTAATMPELDDLALTLKALRRFA